MIIYIASSFDEAQTCESIRTALIALKHQVPDVWWNIRTKDALANDTEMEFYANTLVQSIAHRHWKTIKECDLLILVSNSMVQRSFTGANIEVGYALACGKPVISFGELKRSAMYSPLIKCKTLEALVQAVQTIDKEKR